MITGRIEFVDDRTGVTAFYEFGNCGKKTNPKDYFRGQISLNGQVVSEMYGTCMGYCDFDGKRYWDARSMQNFIAKPIPKTEQTTACLQKSIPLVLQSDCTNRPDSVTLESGDVEAA